MGKIATTQNQIRSDERLCFTRCERLEVAASSPLPLESFSPYRAVQRLPSGTGATRMWVGRRRRRQEAGRGRVALTGFSWVGSGSGQKKTGRDRVALALSGFSRPRLSCLIVRADMSLISNASMRFCSHRLPSCGTWPPPLSRSRSLPSVDGCTEPRTTVCRHFLGPLFKLASRFFFSARKTSKVGGRRESLGSLLMARR